MKISVLRSFAAIGLMLAACFAASWRIVTDVVALTVHTYRELKTWTIKTVRAGLALAGSKPSGRMPSVLLVQARAFYCRLVRRDRPITTEGWRMCPSI